MRAGVRLSGPLPTDRDNLRGRHAPLESVACTLRGVWGVPVRVSLRVQAVPGIVCESRRRNTGTGRSPRDSARSPEAAEN